LKILLLTDLPPCKELTAGLVLDQLCQFVPHGSIACFCVSLPELAAKISPDLTWIPIKYRDRPRETIPVTKFSRHLHGPVNFVLHYYNSTIIRQLIHEAVEFGINFTADMLWCPLQGETQIRLALPVSRKLGIPLVVNVYDDPTWILRGLSTPTFLEKRIMRNFDMILSHSQVCGTASWPMAEKYNNQFSIKTVAFLPSLPSSFAVKPVEKTNVNSDYIIGLAGQIYATKEWETLLSALDKIGWKIGNRDVKIRILGRWARVGANRPLRIEYLGWHSQENTVKLLSESDILYCPYPFDPALEGVARFSFPSKLTTYLAAGRPVLYHGPAYAAPAVFLKENEAGFICESLDILQITQALSILASDTNIYSSLTKNGRIAFDKYLTLDKLRLSFADFLGINSEYLSN
jgi:glycosyltransferase involved in cell wall biosynthesis